MRRCLPILIIAAVSAVAAAEHRTLRLPVTADVGICAHPREVHYNTGANPRVRVKGNEHYYLFAVDAGKLADKGIASATLHLRMAKGGFHKLALCTVPGEWVEGEGRNQATRGAACFTHRRYPDVPWTRAGGTFTDATFNNPRMLWKPVPFEKGKNGWVAIDVPPVMLRAMRAGLTSGIALASETGQTRENHDVYTREQNASAPYVTVTLGPHKNARTAPRHKPEVESAPDFADANSGAIRVDPTLKRAAAARNAPGAWAHRIEVFDPKKPDRAIRSVVTFHDEPTFLPRLPAGRQLMVRVTSFAGSAARFPSRMAPVMSTAQPTPGPVELVGGLPRKRFTRQGGWTLDTLPVSSLVSPSAKPDIKNGGWSNVPEVPRGGWLARQIVLYPPGGQADKVSVTVRQLGDDTAILDDLHVQLFRAWSVPKGNKWVPEVLVPLKAGESVAIPWKKNRIPNQRNQTLVLDVWIPPDAKVGRREFAIRVGVGRKTVLTHRLRFNVSQTQLSDTFEIAGDMNTYSSPAGAMGVRPRDGNAFLAMERKYYRLAHAHRMTLSVLPYSQSGHVHPSSVPELKRSGRGVYRAVDWEEWDKRYGPLLSGAAFSRKAGYVGPAAGKAIRHMYLPLHENWPAPLAEAFKPWPPPTDYQDFLMWSASLPRPSESMTTAARQSFRQVLRQFAQHLAAKGWKGTRYQVYLNNKYYFRRPRRGRPGRGVSLWLLDEPMHAPDFRALAMFGRWTGQTWKRDVQPPVTIDFRIDISRPTHQRDWLDGVVDLNVCADQLYDQRDLVTRRRLLFGERYWNYRMPGSFGSSNVGWSIWPVKSLCWGAVGTLPWQTIASDGDLVKADATALMYPGRKFGLRRPIPSLRMKAWREGLQLAQLLHTLRTRAGWTTTQLRGFVGWAGGLQGWKAGRDPAGESAIVTFRGADLSRVRRAALEKLSRLEPSGR
jgi:hypothetical protein